MHSCIVCCISRRLEGPMFNLPNDRSARSSKKNTQREVLQTLRLAGAVIPQTPGGDREPCFVSVQLRRHSPPRILRYHANDPEEPQGGVIDETNLYPDLAVPLKGYNPSTAENPHWVNLLHTLEAKPFDSATYDRTNVPRYAIDGKLQGVLSVPGRT